MKISIRMYEDGDYESITDCVEPMSHLGSFDAIRDRGVYFTATGDGKPIGCGGIVLIDDDEGEIWLRLSKTICKYPVILVRILKSAKEILDKTFGFKRLVAKVQDDFEPGKRVVRFFGFDKTDKTETICDVQYRVYQCQAF